MTLIIHTKFEQILRLFPHNFLHLPAQIINIKQLHSIKTFIIQDLLESFGNGLLNNTQQILSNLSNLNFHFIFRYTSQLFQH